MTMKVFLVSVFFCASLVSALPQTKDAPTCDESKCLIENNCKCSSTENPLDLSVGLPPQFLAITVSESIVKNIYDDYFVPLFFDTYFNPDGNQIGVTFYVNHEYTDYSLVQKLYNQGFEIGVHSVTKNASQFYWRENATYQQLVEEFDGQRKIISKFAAIPIDDLIGARTPQLQIRDDSTINAYLEAGLSYDNSWVSKNDEMMLPYTLDYASNQECLVSVTCPKESHEGFWVAPITDITGADNADCNSFATCNFTGSAQEIANSLLAELDKYRNGERAPMVLRLDSYWFEFTPNSFEALQIFMDTATQLGDVYLVAVRDILAWMKNPVPVDQYETPYRPADLGCRTITCHIPDNEGEERTMVSCVPCPERYPWRGNPDGIIQ